MFVLMVVRVLRLCCGGHGGQGEEERGLGEPPAADGSIRFAHGARTRSPPIPVTILSLKTIVPVDGPTSFAPEARLSLNPGLSRSKAERSIVQ